jgi:hypothetical protein
MEPECLLSTFFIIHVPLLGARTKERLSIESRLRKIQDPGGTEAMAVVRVPILARERPEMRLAIEVEERVVHVFVARCRRHSFETP